MRAYGWRAVALFQSTLPARGSDDALAMERDKKIEFQSTLPARGSDVLLPLPLPEGIVFQSTLPARGSDERRVKNAR